MVLKTKQLDRVYDMEVYTDSGEFFGSVDESILAMNKVSGWKIRATKKSYLGRVLGGAKGVVIPHQFVKAIGDVMIISKVALPDFEERVAETEENEEL